MSVQEIVTDLKDDEFVTTSITELTGLYDFADQQTAGGGGDLLEIGSYNGRSTCVLASVAKKNNSSFTAVDIECRPFLRENLVYKNLDSHVKLLIQSSRAAFADLKASDKRFDLIFLDGDHFYPTVFWELQNYTTLLKGTGILVGHDFYNTVSNQVQKAVEDFLGSNPLYTLSRFGGAALNPSHSDIMYVLRKAS